MAQNKLEVRFSLPISAPAVAGVGHVQLPLQVDDGEGCAAASDIVDLLLPFDLNILGAAQTEREFVVFLCTCSLSIKHHLKSSQR